MAVRVDDTTWYSQPLLTGGVHPLMLPLCRYPTLDEVLATLNERVIAPAEAKAQELAASALSALCGLP